MNPAKASSGLPWWKTSTESVKRYVASETRSIVSEVHYPGPVVDWLREQLGEGVRASTLLPGATTAEVSTFDVAGRHYVLKLFAKRFFVDEQPDRAVHEAAVLDALSGVEIPAPALVGVDGDGSFCGVPAVLMTRLPGSSGVDAVHASELVGIAARLHSAGITVPWTFERYCDGLETRPPVWGRDEKLWSAALELARSAPPAEDLAFIHRDYNSTNFLSRGNRVTGVVDWLSGCMGPPGIDAARLRLDLTMEGNHDAVTAVTEACHAVGHHIVDPFWDLVDAVDWLPFDQGLDTVDEWGDPVRRKRLEGFMRSAVDRLG